LPISFLKYINSSRNLSKIWGSAHVCLDEISALVHINLRLLRVHWGHIIGLAPFNNPLLFRIGNPSLKEEKS